ncbi:MAG: alpha/beta hydrolase [Acetatifactor sp.]|nr:alpha/beta hydrolase [Acetatifactor sp.]
MASIQAEKLNEMFKGFPEDNDPNGYLKEREEGKKRPTPPIPENVTVKELSLGGNYAELIEKPGNNGPLVMYIHGGGFKTGAAAERRGITFEIADKYGSNVIANDYRLCPENKWPVSLEDCVATYKDILKMGYDAKNIVVAGESAGGSLVLALLLYLRDNTLPMPLAGVVYSASINHGGHYRSHFVNAKTDYMLKNSVACDDDIIAVFGEGEEGVERSKSAYASPCNADLTGLVPIFIAVSDIEALYDDSRVLYGKLVEAGVETKLYEGEGLIHAYPIFPDLPESVDTMKKTFEFIDKLTR